jgi:hypothetical protein
MGGLGVHYSQHVWDQLYQTRNRNSRRRMVCLFKERKVLISAWADIDIDINDQWKSNIP